MLLKDQIEKKPERGFEGTVDAMLLWYVRSRVSYLPGVDPLNACIIEEIDSTRAVTERVSRQSRDRTNFLTRNLVTAKIWGRVHSKIYMTLFRTDIDLIIQNIWGQAAATQIGDEIIKESS